MNALVEHNATRIAVVLWVCFFIYHLATLTISPVVWTDEAFFNSITLSWLADGSLRCPVDLDYTQGKEVLAYGPVFFWLNGLVIKIFGNGLFQGRLLCLLSGMGLLALFGFAFTRFIRQPVVRLVVFTALLLDPFFNAALHWARMDLMATLLFAISCFLLMKESKRTAFRFFASGLFFVIAALTTPRVILLVATPVVLFLQIGIKEKFSRRFIVNAIAWLLPVVVLYGAWIVFAFGDLEAMRRYYDYVREMLLLHERGFYLPRELYPLVVSTLLLVVMSIAVLRKEFCSTLNLFCLTTLIGYYVFVQDTGPYSAIVTPFYYLLIGSIVFRLHERLVYKRLGGAFISFLLLFNAGVFILKATAVIAESKNRNHNDVETFVRSNIPKGSRVAGDVVYYYAAINNAYPFHLLVSYQFYFEPTVDYTLNTFDFDYIILSERLKTATPELYDMYLNQTTLQPIDTFQTERSPLLQKLSAAGLYGYGGYDGVIYKRIR